MMMMVCVSVYMEETLTQEKKDRGILQVHENGVPA